MCRRAGAGLVGLSLSYALSITEILNGVLTTSAETEQEMVSVERVLEYVQLEPQASVLPFIGQRSSLRALLFCSRMWLPPKPSYIPRR